MGCCLCCCCAKDIPRGPRRNSSFSDLETIRPPATEIETLRHEDISQPFLDMNPVLLESTAKNSSYKLEHRFTIDTSSAVPTKGSFPSLFGLGPKP
jgi:hypothetical protein